MKRGLLIVFVLMLLISMAFVSAQGIGEDIKKGIDGFTSAIEPIASKVLGETPDGQYLFAKVLFLIIIFAIVWAALSRVDFFMDNIWVLVIISLAASILATRWLTTEALINTIILPYSALGIAISAGLPFVLYFLVVNVGFKKQPAVIRRVAWIFFAVIFIGLWFTRRPSLLEGSYAGYIYPVTALLAFIMVVLDGTIHKFFINLEVAKLGESSSRTAIDELKKKIADLPNLVTNNIITSAEADARKKEYRRKLNYLMKG